MLCGSAVVIGAEIRHMNAELTLGHVGIPEELCKKISAKLAELTVQAGAVTLFENAGNAVLLEETCVLSDCVEIRE